MPKTWTPDGNYAQTRAYRAECAPLTKQQRKRRAEKAKSIAMRAANPRPSTFESRRLTQDEKDKLVRREPFPITGKVWMRRGDLQRDGSAAKRRRAQRMVIEIRQRGKLYHEMYSNSPLTSKSGVSSAGSPRTPATPSGVPPLVELADGEASLGAEPSASSQISASGGAASSPDTPPSSLREQHGAPPGDFGGEA